MKKKFKSTVLLGVCLMFTMVLFAQDHKEPNKPKMSKEQREQKFAEASKRLNLTANQEIKMKAIIEQNKAEMKTLREENKDKSKEEKRSIMLSQLKKMDTEVNAILDTQQKEIYKQIKAENKAENKAEMKKKRAEKKKMHEEMEDYQGIL